MLLPAAAPNIAAMTEKINNKFILNFFVTPMSNLHEYNIVITELKRAACKFLYFNSVLFNKFIYFLCREFIFVR